MHKRLDIIVVDDHPIFLMGLVEVLKSELKNCQIRSYMSSLKALEDSRDLAPDFAVLDLDMPEMNGIALASRLKQACPSIKIIILTMHKEPDVIRSLIAQGVDGYVFKDDAVNEVVMAIDFVLEGKQFISSTEIKNPFVPTELQSLTKMEGLILKMIANGKSSREIAEDLFISIKTVNNHRNNISRKLQLKGSNSLLKFALDNKEFIDHQIQNK